MNTAKVIPFDSNNNQHYYFDNFRDDNMLRLLQVAKQAASQSNTVLITGEIGTGKRELAKYIARMHQQKYQLIDIQTDRIVSCETQLEKLLNDYETTTIIINNIDMLSLKSQIYLNHKMGEQVGSRNPKKVIAICSQDINKAIASGTFMRELYFRLNIVRLDIPSLKHHKRDIPALAQYFLNHHSHEKSYNNLSLTHDAQEKLIAHNWPGNILELKSVIERAILLSTSFEIDKTCIEIDSKPKTDTSWIETLPIGATMKQVETHFILETIKYHNGNRTHSAKTLGISLRTLRNKINEFKAEGIQVMEPTSGQ